MTMLRNKWFTPLVALLIGCVILGAQWVGGDPRTGVYSLGVMAAFALLVLVGGRFDLVRGLRGDGRDEYWARIDVHATALTGLFAVGLIIGMCIWEWAHGRDGSPYTQLGAIAGVAYVLAVVVLRIRG